MIGLPGSCRGGLACHALARVADIV